MGGRTRPRMPASPSVPNAEHEPGLESNTVEVESRGAKVIGYLPRVSILLTAAVAPFNCFDPVGFVSLDKPSPCHMARGFKRKADRLPADLLCCCQGQHTINDRVRAR